MNLEEEKTPSLVQNKKNPTSTPLKSAMPNPSSYVVFVNGEPLTQEGLGEVEGKEVLGDTTSEQDTEDGILVTEVFDGDTLKLENGEIIRLLGINAPEKGQPYSAKSTQFLKETLLNRPVQLTFDVQNKDRYGRTLGYVYSGSLFVNLELARRGLAVIETIAPNVAHSDEIKAAQDDAKKNCRGLWEGLCGKTGESGLGSGSSCVYISQINADPPGNDTNKKNEEWVEIKNSCSDSVQLSSYLIKDSSASNTYTFNAFSLGSNGVVKIHSGCGQDSSTDLYWKCPEGRYAIWNNSGDHAYLYNSSGVLVSDYQY